MGVSKALCILCSLALREHQVTQLHLEGAFEGHGEGTGRWTEPRLGYSGGRLSLRLQPFADTDLCPGPTFISLQEIHDPKPSVAFRQKKVCARFGQPKQFHPLLNHIPIFNLIASWRKCPLSPGREEAWILGLPWV